MSKEDIELVIDYMQFRKRDFERFLKEQRGISPHAAVFIIEDLECRFGEPPRCPTTCPC